MSRETLVDCIVLALAAGIFAGGYYLGGLGPKAELAAYKAAATVQTVKNEATAAQGAAVSKSTGVEYEKASSNVRAKYGPGRVLHAGTRGSKAAPVPQAARVTDAGPADPGPSASIRPPGPNDCEGLRADAAITTVQFLFLRDWVEQQGELWESLSSSADPLPSSPAP